MFCFNITFYFKVGKRSLIKYLMLTLVCYVHLQKLLFLTTTSIINFFKAIW